MLETVDHFIDRNAERVLTPQEIEGLEKPHRVNTYVEMTEDGPVVITRTQHTMGKDGSGGGMKLKEVGRDMPLDEMKRLSAIESLGLGTLMTLKSLLATIKLPEGYGNDVGGAKAVGLVPEGYLAEEKIAPILEGYTVTQYESGLIGVGIDRHAPDMRTGPFHMNLMARKLVDHTGRPIERAAFSGKSLEEEGLEGREIATAQGMVHTLANHLKTMEIDDPSTVSVSVQGAGNVGFHFARLASEQLGVKIMGISSRTKAIFARDARQPLIVGNADALHANVKVENGEFVWFDEAVCEERADPDDLYDLKTTVFTFAAMPDAVSAKNMRRIKAKILLEGANNPLDVEATDYYIANKQAVISGILANMAGFVGSNIEYNQNVRGMHWEEVLVLDALKGIIDEAYQKVAAEAEDQYNFVDPAYSAAIKEWRRTRYGSPVGAY